MNEAQAKELQELRAKYETLKDSHETLKDSHKTLKGAYQRLHQRLERLSERVPQVDWCPSHVPSATNLADLDAVISPGNLAVCPEFIAVAHAIFGDFSVKEFYPNQKACNEILEETLQTIVKEVEELDQEIHLCRQESTINAIIQLHLQMMLLRLGQKPVACCLNRPSTLYPCDRVCEPDILIRCQNEEKASIFPFVMELGLTTGGKLDNKKAECFAHGINIMQNCYREEQLTYSPEQPTQLDVTPDLFERVDFDSKPNLFPVLAVTLRVFLERRNRASQLPQVRRSQGPTSTQPRKRSCVSPNISAANSSSSPVDSPNSPMDASKEDSSAFLPALSPSTSTPPSTSPTRKPSSVVSTPEAQSQESTDPNMEFSTPAIPIQKTQSQEASPRTAGSSVAGMLDITGLFPRAGPNWGVLSCPLLNVSQKQPLNELLRRVLVSVAIFSAPGFIKQARFQFPSNLYFNEEGENTYCYKYYSPLSSRTYRHYLDNSFARLDAKVVLSNPDCGTVIRYQAVEGSHVPSTSEQFIPIVQQVRAMHQKSIAHGDIRLANMIFHTTPEHSRLIDFDLSGTAGQHRYPAGYVTEIPDTKRHCQAQPNGILQKQHDWHALKAVMSFFRPVSEQDTMSWNEAIQKLDSSEVPDSLSSLSVKLKWAVEPCIQDTNRKLVGTGSPKAGAKRAGSEQPEEEPARKRRRRTKEAEEVEEEEEEEAFRAPVANAKMTVSQLRKLCQDRGLSTTGLKNELIKRLNGEEDEEEATEAPQTKKRTRAQKKPPKRATRRKTNRKRSKGATGAQ